MPSAAIFRCVTSVSISAATSSPRCSCQNVTAAVELAQSLDQRDRHRGPAMNRPAVWARHAIPNIGRAGSTKVRERQRTGAIGLPSRSVGAEVAWLIGSRPDNVGFVQSGIRFSAASCRRVSSASSSVTCMSTNRRAEGKLYITAIVCVARRRCDLILAMLTGDIAYDPNRPENFTQPIETARAVHSGTVELGDRGLRDDGGAGLFHHIDAGESSEIATIRGRSWGRRCPARIGRARRTAHSGLSCGSEQGTRRAPSMGFNPIAPRTSPRTGWRGRRRAVDEAIEASLFSSIEGCQHLLGFRLVGDS